MHLESYLRCVGTRRRKLGSQKLNNSLEVTPLVNGKSRMGANPRLSEATMLPSPSQTLSSPAASVENGAL